MRNLTKAIKTAQKEVKFNVENLVKTLLHYIEKKHVIYAHFDNFGFKDSQIYDERTLIRFLERLAKNADHFKGILVSVNPAIDVLKLQYEKNCDIESNDFIFAYDLDIIATKKFVSRLIANLQENEKVKEASIWLSASGRLHVYVKVYKQFYKDLVQDLDALKQFKVELLKELLFGQDDVIELDLTGKLDKVKDIQWMVWLEGSPNPAKNFKKSVKIFSIKKPSNYLMIQKEVIESLPSYWRASLYIRRSEFEGLSDIKKAVVEKLTTGKVSKTTAKRYREVAQTDNATNTQGQN